jgi:hypothetical protein
VSSSGQPALTSHSTEHEITNLDGQIITGGFLNRAIEGQPIAVMWGKEYAGVDPDNGDALYYLHSPDGKDYRRWNYKLLFRRE